MQKKKVQNKRRFVLYFFVVSIDQKAWYNEKIRNEQCKNDRGGT